MSPPVTLAAPCLPALPVSRAGAAVHYEDGECSHRSDARPQLPHSVATLTEHCPTATRGACLSRHGMLGRPEAK
jgi:hypothetical protein